MPYSPMQLADAFIKTGELTDALDALNQQLGEEPHDEGARRLRADVLLRLGESEYLKKALQDITCLSEITATDYHSASVIHERLGAFDNALESMHKARQLAPDDERLTERLLNLFMSQKKYDEALELIRQQQKTWRWLQYEGDVLALMGDDTMATARYGLVLAQLEERDGVMRADYLQAIKARVFLACAHAYHRLQQIEIAREQYQAAQSLLPEDPTIGFNLGLLDALSGDIENAVSRCRAALENALAILRDEMLNSIRDEATYRALWTKLKVAS